MDVRHRCINFHRPSVILCDQIIPEFSVFQQIDLGYIAYEQPNLSRPSPIK